MTKLTAVYLTKTLHVLAALTRTDPPQGDEPVSALIGTGLPVRFIGQLPVNVTFHATDLSAVTVDDQPDVLVNRQSYRVVKDPQTQALQVTGVGAANQVQLTIDHQSGAAVTVAFTANVSGEAIVILQKLTTPSTPPIIAAPFQVVSGVNPVPGLTGFVKNDLWNMYALVQGLPPVSSQITVT